MSSSSSTPQDDSMPDRQSAGLPLPAGAFFQPLLSQSLNGFAVVDKEGHYVYCSPSMSNLFGYTTAEMQNKHAADFCHPEDRAALLKLVETASINPGVMVRLRHLRSNGTYLPVETKACSDGMYVYEVLLDASVPARLEDSLRDFLLSTSHDLRTPCHSISSSASLLAKVDAVAQDAESKVLLKTIQGSTKALTSIVNNVLKLKQMQRGTAMLTSQSIFSPRDVVMEAVAQMHAMSYGHARHSCELDIGELPELCQGDRENLSECLTNMVLTTARFAAWDRGKATARITVSADSRQATEQGFVLTVTMLAPGRAMTDAECAVMLSPFGMAPQDKGEGTGLALFIARSLARAIGGDLVLEQGRKAGVALKLSIPMLHATAESKVIEPAPALKESLSGPTEQLGLDEPVAALRQVAEQLGEPLSARMFEYLVNNSDDTFAICSVDKAAEETMRLVYISPNVQRRMCFTQEDLVGRDMIDFCHPDDQAAMAKAVKAALVGVEAGASLGTMGNLLCQHRNLAGMPGPEGPSYVWCETAGVTDGQYFYLVCRDVRVRKAVESALRAFTISTSHDLREPCNSILVAVSMLEQRASVLQDDEAHFLVKAIRASCGLMLGIVTNVLTVRQVEAGELLLCNVVFNPTTVIEDVLHACRLGCTAHVGAAGIHWHKDVGDHLPELMDGDRDRLAQVVQNLVTNAVKFGMATGVFVTVHLEAPAAHTPNSPRFAGLHWLTIRVSDKGRGMSLVESDASFTIYQHADERSGGGTGLGLFISKAFASVMGGTLSVLSETGKGSAFTLCIPVRVLDPEETRKALELEAEVEKLARTELARVALDETAAAKAAAAAEEILSPSKRRASVLAPPLRRYKALLADDHPLNLQLVKHLMKLNGFDTTAVADGEQALEALIASYEPGARPYDVAVLDMQMPVMSGPAAAAAFRAWEAEHLPGQGRMPIIALTANVMEKHAQACKDAGMDAFLSKPLRSDAMTVLRSHAVAWSEACILRKESITGSLPPSPSAAVSEPPPI